MLGILRSFIYEWGMVLHHKRGAEPKWRIRFLQYGQRMQRLLEMCGTMCNLLEQLNQKQLMQLGDFIDVVNTCV